MSPTLLVLQSWTIKHDDSDISQSGISWNKLTSDSDSAYQNTPKTHLWSFLWHFCWVCEFSPFVLLNCTNIVFILLLIVLHNHIPYKSIHTVYMSQLSYQSWDMSDLTFFLYIHAKYSVVTSNSFNRPHQENRNHLNFT